MTSMTMGTGGELTLPPDIQEHYGLHAGAAVRVVETRGGVLLVPLTAEPMAPELAREIAEWQELGTPTWDAFAYEDDDA